MDEENWILFDGAMLVPASLGVQAISKALPVTRTYGKPLEISNDAMSFRIVTADEVTQMRVKDRFKPGTGS